MVNLNSNQNQTNTAGFNRCIAVAYSRRAESVINDRCIDAQTRALIRYALETSDPWLAELLRRVDAGESLVDTVDFSQEPQVRNDDDLVVDKIEALAEMICRSGDEPDTKSAALLVLMAAFETPRTRKHCQEPESSYLPYCEFNLWGYLSFKAALRD